MFAWKREWLVANNPAFCDANVKFLNASLLKIKKWKLEEICFTEYTLVSGCSDCDRSCWNCRSNAQHSFGCSIRGEHGWYRMGLDINVCRSKLFARGKRLNAFEFAHEKQKVVPPYLFLPFKLFHRIYFCPITITATIFCQKTMKKNSDSILLNDVLLNRTMVIRLSAMSNGYT